MESTTLGAKPILYRQETDTHQTPLTVDTLS